MRKIGIGSLILMLVCMAALQIGTALVLPRPFLKMAAVLCVISICTAVIASPGKDILKEVGTNAGENPD